MNWSLIEWILWTTLLQQCKNINLTRHGVFETLLTSLFQYLLIIIRTLWSLTGLDFIYKKINQTENNFLRALYCSRPASKLSARTKAQSGYFLLLIQTSNGRTRRLEQFRALCMLAVGEYCGVCVFCGWGLKVYELVWKTFLNIYLDLDITFFISN